MNRIKRGLARLLVCIVLMVLPTHLEDRLLAGDFSMFWFVFIIFVSGAIYADISRWVDENLFQD